MVKASFTQGFREMREGIRFLEDHADAARGIAAIAIQRGGLTALTLMTLVLERNFFNDPQDPDAGLAGVTFMIVTAAIGLVIGAIVAPFGVARFGRHRWIRFAMLAASVGVISLAFTRTSLTLALTAFFTALCGQSVKVTNDALVQSKIDDIYRGRVFAVYDVVVNISIVSGALIAAILLPTNGDTWTLPAVVGVGYLLTALTILRPSKFFIRSA
jgi:MFS family permease